MEVDLDKLFKYGLSPSEYILIQLIRLGQLDDSRFNYEKPLKRLQDKGYINSQKELTVKVPEELVGTKKKEDLEPFWEQFKMMYPKKDGPRRLHDSPSKCKEKYIRILRRDSSLHKQIIKGLKTENEVRADADKRNEFFQAPKLMTTYINQKAWEGYLDIDEIAKDTTDKDVI
jgi:hypothetical protein